MMKKKDLLLEQILGQCYMGSSTNYWVPLTIYNPEAHSYQTRYFNATDVYRMRQAGIEWLVQMCNHALAERSEPWWHHAWNIREHLEVDPAKYIFPETDKIGSDVEKEKILQALFWFAKQLYVCKRYKWRQPLLWEDMRKDYLSSRKFFGAASPFHIRLLMLHIAAQIGYNELGNVAGD